MKTWTNKEIESNQEFKPFSFTDLFTPTIEMAAELMNVSPTVIKEWLSCENYPLESNGHLSKDTIDFLARKYVDRLHKYFDNCLAIGEDLDGKERVLFTQFKSKYGKRYRFHIEKWSDIDVRRISKDFIIEIENKALDAYFQNVGLECIDFTDSIIAAQESAPFSSFPFGCLNNSERTPLLSELSHSLYYGSRLKTKIPARPGYRNIVLEILQENRFHIFTGESDSNALIDAFLSSNVKQPQLAIASVFGCLRHKNKRIHDTYFQNQAYNRS